MQIKSLRVKSYRSWKIDETIISEAAKQKRDKILLYDKIRNNECPEAVALEAITTPRATFFRWQGNYRQYGIKGLLEKSSKPINTRQRSWDRGLYLKILTIRKENPCWGKITIHTILNRDFNLSVPITKVGRIISELIAKNKLQSLAFVTGKKLL